MADHVDTEAGVIEEPPRRQSSFTDTLNKFASNTFGHRRTKTDLPRSESQGNIYQNSRLPRPSGTAPSSSFFSGLSAFSRHDSAAVREGLVEKNKTSPAVHKPTRKISANLAATPFFKHQVQTNKANTAPMGVSTPFRVSKPNKARRDSSDKIKHHGFMQPIQPPLPCSRTMSNIDQNTSPGSPSTASFMRPTISSAARDQNLANRHSVVVQQSQDEKSPRYKRAHGLDVVEEEDEEDSPKLIMEVDGHRVTTPIRKQTFSQGASDDEFIENENFATNLNEEVAQAQIQAEETLIEQLSRMELVGDQGEDVLDEDRANTPTQESERVKRLARRVDSVRTFPVTPTSAKKSTCNASRRAAEAQIQADQALAQQLSTMDLADKRVNYSPDDEDRSITPTPMSERAKKMADRVKATRTAPETPTPVEKSKRTAPHNTAGGSKNPRVMSAREAQMKASRPLPFNPLALNPTTTDELERLLPVSYVRKTPAFSPPAELKPATTSEEAMAWQPAKTLSLDFTQPAQSASDYDAQGIKMGRLGAAELKERVEALGVDNPTQAKKTRNIHNLTLGGGNQLEPTKPQFTADKVKFEGMADRPGDDSDPGIVREALSTSTWAGRLTALSDRYGAERAKNPADDANDPLRNDADLARAAYAELMSTCVTDEARRSLEAFGVVLEEQLVAWWEKKAVREGKKKGGSAAGASSTAAQTPSLPDVSVKERTKGFEKFRLGKKK